VVVPSVVAIGVKSAVQNADTGDSAVPKPDAGQTKPDRSAVAGDTAADEHVSDRAAPPAPSGDAELVAAALRGERDAFARLYERYGPVVHGALIARVPAQDADDITQDVFVVALRRLWMLRQGDSVGGWLLAIARARAADYWRQVAPREQVAAGTAAQAPSLAPRADAARVLSALRELPDAYREVLAMRLIEGLSGPEIAERSGLTPGSVRVNLHRGMKLLRKKLGWKETR
jgi:RNA polymerase sigma-70 factor, ECF subfamily